MGCCNSPTVQTTIDLGRRQESEKCVRSEAIFRAKEIIANKYNLCQAVGKSARLFNTSSIDIQGAINQAFERVAIASDTPIMATLATVVL
jgi:hypothetical protein